MIHCYKVTSLFFSFIHLLSQIEHIHLLVNIVPHHIETIQLIWIANQLTGFYVMGGTDR